MFLASAPAIVLYFVLPGGWAIVGPIAGLEAPRAGWTARYSLAPMTDHLMSAMEWARAGTTLAVDAVAAAHRPVAHHAG